MTEDTNKSDLLKIEVEILLCMDNPQQYIWSFRNNVFDFFKDVIYGTMPPEVAKAMDFIPDKSVWCRKYIETLIKFIENLTPQFVSDLSWSDIFECDNQFQQSLYYRTYIIKKGVISSDEHIAEILENGLKDSLKRCIGEFGKAFQNGFYQDKS